MFADRAKIFVRSGKGGDGHVSFRRELYVPNGGPDGGDGGDGGNVVFVVDQGLNTLTDFRNIRKYKAEDGEEGRKRNCHGANGKDVVLKVPPGTVIRDFETGKVILDMADRTEPVVLFKGGRGGKGNQHYVTSVMQAPKYAQPGQPAIEKYLQLEMKMIADVGLVGFPSAGKSTLLSVTTNARPKIAEYHFTTLSPNLGVVDLPDAPGFVMADIPGIIEGASEGVGLGFDFLRHIERTRVLVHVVDAAGVEGRDPVEDVRQINEELEKYNAELASRPMILACNKLDLLDEEERAITMQFLEEAYADRMVKILPISAATKEGVKELLYTISDLLKELPKEKIIFQQEIDPDSFRETEQLSFTVEKSDEEEGLYIVEGPKIERMLGYTNLEDEKGFLFFQKFMKENGILQQLEDLGIQDGETVRVYGHEFDYYHE
ncbi:MAG: GTPase ObgE [Eubacterium sp.]|nr:GTPase ObgE [Eubacterium sp.]